MPKPLLCLSRLLAAPVMAAINARFRLSMEPGTAPPARDQFIKGLGAADAVICTLTERMDAELLQSAPRLKVIANHAVGYNNIDLRRPRRAESS